jgi:hypothetical protein
VILSCMMWPSTPAGRQHLAWRCRTCCLRRSAAARPPRCFSFEAQSHTPHDCCVRFVAVIADGTSRNTRYQAGATPYLGRTFAGWIAPASPDARRTKPVDLRTMPHASGTNSHKASIYRRFLPCTIEGECQNYNTSKYSCSPPLLRLTEWRALIVSCKLVPIYFGMGRSGPFSFRIVVWRR